MKSSDRRSTFELNAPARPLSAVMITTCRRGPSRCSSNGCAAPSAATTRLPSISFILLAYGRAAKIRSWARRNFAAATSFMALVIFWVDWTDRIRRWMSRSVAIDDSGRLDAPGPHELGLGLAQCCGERVPQLVAQLLLVGDVGQELRVRAAEEGIKE